MQAQQEYDFSMNFKEECEIVSGEHGNILPIPQVAGNQRLWNDLHTYRFVVAQLVMQMCI